MGTITRGYANLITADGPNAVASGSIQAADLAAGVGGKVLQVVTATDSTSRSTSSTSFVTASNGLSVSITPSSNSNKIFIETNFTAWLDGTSEAKFTIFRNATNLGTVNGMVVLFNGASGSQITIPSGMSYLDSPNSTSALTYQVYVKLSSGTVNFILGTASITAFEIAG
jgi:hypothetical protein